MESLLQLLRQYRLSEPDEDIVSFLLSIDASSDIDELASLFALYVGGFSKLPLSRKSAFIKSFRQVSTEHSKAAAGIDRELRPLGSASDASSSPPQSVGRASPPTPVGAVVSAASMPSPTADLDADEEEMIELEIPRSLIPRIAALRECVGDAIPLELLIDALLRCDEDVDAAAVRVLDSCGSADTASAQRHAAEAGEFDRLVAQLRGDAAPKFKTKPAAPRQPQRQRFSELRSDSPAADPPKPNSPAPSSSQRASFLSSGPSPAATLRTDPAAVGARAGLAGMFPDLSPPQLEFALRKHGYDVNAAAMYALGGELDTDFRIAEAAAQRNVAVAGGGGARGGGSSVAAAGGRGGGGAGEELHDPLGGLKSDPGVKSAIMQRFDEQPDTSDVTHKPKIAWSAPSQKGGRTQRFLDGEKFVIENLKQEDPATFVSLKIKRKKKGGPSPGFV